jgi:hypothetical protein
MSSTVLKQHLVSCDCDPDPQLPLRLLRVTDCCRRTSPATNRLTPGVRHGGLLPHAPLECAYRSPPPAKLARTTSADDGGSTAHGT